MPQDQRHAGALEIEITPAMIDAGGMDEPIWDAIYYITDGRRLGLSGLAVKEIRSMLLRAYHAGRAQTSP